MTEVEILTQDLRLARRKLRGWYDLWRRQRDRSWRLQRERDALLAAGDALWDAATDKRIDSGRIEWAAEAWADAADKARLDSTRGTTG